LDEDGVMRQLGRAVAVVAVLVAASACVSIPKRAWDNGASMSRNDAYWSMMWGDRSFHSARQAYSSMDPYRSLYQARPYAPFGRW
jgi:hypothetical protein